MKKKRLKKEKFPFLFIASCLLVLACIYSAKFWLSERYNQSPALLLHQSCINFFEKKDFAQAHSQCKKAILADDKYQPAYITLTKTYLASKHLENHMDYATATVESLLRFARENEEGWFLLGQIAEDRQKPRQAKIFYENALIAAKTHKNELLLVQINVRLNALKAAKPMP